ncbi:isochorismatase hydrolase [Candidatus Koribacter versatilis Ellin345]|uniref:Isochorismatase hydrolase n=1 Tax=Koribacter versatilis (strain Ellin345) TaxID=204669 RepID=Q1IP93_KORVE|nr:isochorismatase family protein [Candidatus Koribacter versatilis]ABF41307.1 isochorismatase hydrolase [Candidatus Koribacter versatilis Ellin345]
MPLTQLDTKAALILIDLQKGIVARPTAHPAAEIVSRAAQLAQAFRDRGLPVILVNVAGRPPGRNDAGPIKMPFPPDWTELVPELNVRPSDHRLTKRSLGAFATTELHELLEKLTVTQVFMAGISTSIGVESTARYAYDLGYNMVFISDAMTDGSAESHRHSLEKIFPRLGEIETTENVLARLKAS